MEPDSLLLPIAIAIGAGGLLVAMVRYRRLAVRIITGMVSLLLAATVGIIVVNDYYGYYQTWSQLKADLSGAYAQSGSAATSAGQAGPSGRGRVESLRLPGARSGIDRRGMVYLPPQYFQPSYAHTDFPVVELLHGSPGTPSTWLVHLGLATTADRLIGNRLMGPLILVMPAMNAGKQFQDGVNAAGAADDTYLTSDVRADIEARYRASRTPAEWGIAGYSSGGYGAANLALRHPAAFGASGAMDGYFRPQDGPAATVLRHEPAAERANDPLLAAGRLRADGRPVPAFWVSAGSGDPGDVAAARAFMTALRPVESVPYRQIPSAGHNFYAWEPAIPFLLQWMWGQLAPPSLRVRFPIAGGVGGAAIDLTPTLPTPGSAPGSAPGPTPGSTPPAGPAGPAPRSPRPPMSGGRSKMSG